MPLRDRVQALFGRLRGPRRPPEERLRRHAERVDAEREMRREIERASLEQDRAMPGNRGNRFVR